MILPAVVLDAAMTVEAVLNRLARCGFWINPEHPAALAVVEEFRAQIGDWSLSAEEIRKKLEKDPFRAGAAIRRQWHNQILWYARPVNFVLGTCLFTAPSQILSEALNLHEYQSVPELPVPKDGEVPADEGVVFAGGLPVAVNLRIAMAGPPEDRLIGFSGPPVKFRGTTREPVVPPPIPETIAAWPLLDAPSYVAALVRFDVVVGLSQQQQAGVTGERLAIPVPQGATTVDLTVELIADGVDAPNGWTQPLPVSVADPTSARAKFTLMGRIPEGREPVHLTMIEARFVRAGAICGTAARPLEIRAPGYQPPQDVAPIGKPWDAQETVASDIKIAADEVADLTIEIAKPDGNIAGSRYVCRLYSPHTITADRGPHPVDFGEDSKTFARSLVDKIRSWSNDPLIKLVLKSHASIVADKLPDAAYTALQEVAALTTPNPPSVLIVSAEPYVPWELALVDPPLDPKFPPFLGAQTYLGRWLRDSVPDIASPGPRPPAHPKLTRQKKPPVQPPGRIPVRHMAVMAGFYDAQSGLRSLPEAEKEAEALTQQYDAVALAASSSSVLELLEARLQYKFKQIGAPGAVHFAGHGDFNPSDPDSSVMFLSNGKPLSSDLFRSANYGGDSQPLIFLNACMIGIGGELLGDMGGFPGNCLKGGFGGVLGALWEVDDTVARDIALEFWRRALTSPGTSGEPVAAILRDLRAKYDPNSPVATYLAYVYYGHPRLTLERILG
jgi:hypothetical protein